MPITLHAAAVGAAAQTLAAMDGVLAKGAAWCEETGTDPETLVAARLYPDMGSFRFQVVSVCHHATAGPKALISGAYSVHSERIKPDYAALRAMIAAAREEVAAITPEMLEGRDGAEVIFTFNEERRRFTTESFTMGYILPNLHFHATTTYGLLRQAGVPVGKRDYLGPATWA